MESTDELAHTSPVITTIIRKKYIFSHKMYWLGPQVINVN